MKEKKQKKRLDIGLLYNVIMLLLFIAKTVKSLSNTAEESGPLEPFILAALVVYVLMFAATIIINLNDKKKLKSETGEYKYAANQTKKSIKIVKMLLNLVNVATALLIAVDGYQAEGFKAILELITAALALIFAIYKIIKAVKKLSKAKQKHDKKKQKLQEKQEKAALKEQQTAEKKALSEAKKQKEEKPKK